MRGGEYKERVFKMHLKARHQQLNYVYIYNAIQKSHSNCKPKIYNRYTHKKHTNKWKESLFSRNGTINIVKTSMLPKAVDTVNAIPPTIPWYFPPKQSKSS